MTTHSQFRAPKFPAEVVIVGLVTLAVFGAGLLTQQDLSFGARPGPTTKPTVIVTLPLTPRPATPTPTRLAPNSASTKPGVIPLPQNTPSRPWPGSVATTHPATPTPTVTPTPPPQVTVVGGP
jgi:hypothetical protein